jgi:hypothetical protein
VRIALLLAVVGLAPASVDEAAPAPMHGPPAVPDVAEAPTFEGPRSPHNANYTMSVRLDPETKTITGRQVLHWRNVSARPTSELQYHLYYNAWRNGDASWWRTGIRDRAVLDDVADDGWAYQEVESIALMDPDAEPVDLLPGAQFIAPDDGNFDDRTVLRVPLPRPVGPGEEIDVELHFSAKVPRTFARTGFRGDYYLLAQWFPKVGVLEDEGWNCHQFIQTEFFSDFGRYDVSLQVPTGWVVGATGREAERTDNGDGTTTHRYVEADVHDFAWTTSPRFSEHLRRFEYPGLPSVEMRLLLMPDHAGLVDRYFEATAMALQYYGKWWGAYPYDHVTVVDPAYGSKTGGMEYPTLFTGGARWLAPRAARSPEGVTVHEMGHQFWYGVVANNEFEDAWLDEGFNTYSTTRTLEAALPEHALVERYFEGFLPVVFDDIVPAERTAGADRHAGPQSALLRDPQSRPSYQAGPSGYHVNAYDKGSLTLRTLENYLGWNAFQRVVSTYYRTYAFRHPKPQDFFHTAKLVAGVDLDWYFDQTWRDAVTFDYAVDRVVSEPASSPRGYVEGEGGLALVSAPVAEDAGDYTSHVYVRRWGQGRFPVAVAVTFEDGTRKVERWDGQDAWAQFTFTRPSKVERVEVDPDHQLVLDVDFSNNGWLKKSQANVAAAKWSSKWMVWVQHAMEGMAMFS